MRKFLLQACPNPIGSFPRAEGTSSPPRDPRCLGAIKPGAEAMIRDRSSLTGAAAACSLGHRGEVSGLLSIMRKVYSTRITVSSISMLRALWPKLAIEWELA